MSKRIKYDADFYEGGIFHVYNRTNNKELLFQSDENRQYFLNQYAKYLHPFAETFCWCLLPNHFHFLIRIRMAEEIKKYLQQQVQLLKPVEKGFATGSISMEHLLEFEWRRFFTAYSMAYNKQHHRKRNLFQRPFKRVEVEKESYFTQVVIYIHANAQHHGLCRDFTQYKWSSWQSMIANGNTMLNRNEVLEWFGGREQFIKVHTDMIGYYHSCNVAIERDDTF